MLSICVGRYSCTFPVTLLSGSWCDGNAGGSHPNGRRGQSQRHLSAPDMVGRDLRSLRAPSQATQIAQLPLLAECDMLLVHSSTRVPRPRADPSTGRRAAGLSSTNAGQSFWAMTLPKEIMSTSRSKDTLENMSHYGRVLLSNLKPGRGDG